MQGETKCHMTLRKFIRDKFIKIKQIMPTSVEANKIMSSKKSDKFSMRKVTNNTAEE